MKEAKNLFVICYERLTNETTSPSLKSVWYSIVDQVICQNVQLKFVELSMEMPR